VPTVSVVIPCYNGEAFLGEALESVRAQTRQPDEILVVNDGSTDRTADIARAFGGVRLLENAVNMGPSVTRNRALFSVRNEIVAFIDADDLWLPHHLETMLGLLERYPDAGVAFSAVEFFGDREGVWRASALPDSEPTDAFWECLRHNTVPQMSAVARHSALGLVGGWQQPSPVHRSAADYDVWLRLSLHTPFIAVHEITARYRWHPEQISQTLTDDQIASVYHSRRRVLYELGRDPADDRHAQVAAKIRQYWIEDYLQAFHARDMERTRILLEVRRSLFPEMELPSKIRLRSLVPGGLIRAVDALRGGRRETPPSDTAG
jgi:glycosyltransferase involved in cell wall biosynthesis